MNRQRIARETLEVLEQGRYLSPSGGVVEIGSALRECVNGTQYYEPDQLARIREEVLSQAPHASDTSIEVRNETTLQGSERLSETHLFQRIGVLNFASARNPGGGFLGGASAQEESLARSSALYPSLLRCPDYYAFHRAERTCLYSDHMIYSPRCPVLRRDSGEWLESPYLVDFLTSPAPNAGAIRRNEPERAVEIEPVLRERSGKVLALAASPGCDALVLGAWGCGVFRNDPEVVAAAFHEHLNPDGPFWGRFRRVLFAVYDRSSEQSAFGSFERAFGGAS